MKLKTILLQGTALFFCAALLISCETSKKGKWTAEDKAKARKIIEKSIADLGDGAFIFQDKEIREKFLNCSIAKLEQNYSSLSSANKDKTGVEKIGSECGESIATEMLQNLPQEEDAPSEESEEIDQ